MKPVTAIFFIVLYTAFAQFAVVGFAATKCYYNAYKTIVSGFKDTGVINTDNHKDCNHKPAVTAHAIHKQTINVSDGGNKCISLNRQFLYPYNSNDLQLLHSSTLYTQVTIPIPYPLFIKYCVFRI